MTAPTISIRRVPLRAEDQLILEGLHPVLARLAAARGISGRGELDDALDKLLLPAALMGMDTAAKRLADAAPGAAGPQPVHIREAFRTRGPSNYHHGKQEAADA